MAGLLALVLLPLLRRQKQLFWLHSAALLFCCCFCFFGFAFCDSGARKTLQEIEQELTNCSRWHLNDGFDYRANLSVLSVNNNSSSNSSRAARTKRIVGGRRSRHGEWPWLVSFRSNNEVLAWFFTTVRGDKVHAGHYCGGVLIHPEWVLSARHCFDDSMISGIKLGLGDPNSWTAVVGEHDIEWRDHTELEIQVRDIFLAPKRTNDGSTSWHPDLALLRLRRPVPLSRYARPVCLTPGAESVRPGDWCVVAGWGKISDRVKQHSTKLLHASVKIRYPKVCTWAYNRESEEEGLFHPTGEICAVGDFYATDACQFDSGSPLMCKSTSSGGGPHWSAAGIVSRGSGCAKFGFPGIYASVADSMAWIAGVLHRHQG